jgi:hypothetical protein
MDDDATALAQFRSRFASIAPNGAAERRLRENAPIAVQDRRQVIGGRAGVRKEVRDAQITFKVRPSQRASFFRTAQGYGVTAVVFFEALISFAREHEAEFRMHLAAAMQRGRD